MQASQFLFPRPVGPTIGAVVIEALAYSIEVWYDRRAKHWVIQAKDAWSRQIGESDFAANKSFALDLAADKAVEHGLPGHAIVLTTFNGKPVKQPPHPTKLYRRVRDALERSLRSKS